MASYHALTAYLLTQQADELSLTFDMLEDATRIGIELPTRAKAYRQWWANHAKPGAHQCLAWLVAGWRVIEADLPAQRITFRRLPVR